MRNIKEDNKKLIETIKDIIEIHCNSCPSYIKDNCVDLDGCYCFASANKLIKEMEGG